MSQEDSITVPREELDELQEDLRQIRRQVREDRRVIAELQDSNRDLGSKLQFTEQMNQKLRQDVKRLHQKEGLFMDGLAQFRRLRQTSADQYQSHEEQLMSTLQGSGYDETFGGSETPSSQSSYQSVTSRPRGSSSLDYQEFGLLRAGPSSPPQSCLSLRTSPDRRRGYLRQFGRGSDEDNPSPLLPPGQPLVGEKRSTSDLPKDFDSSRRQKLKSDPPVPHQRQSIRGPFDESLLSIRTHQSSSAHTPEFAVNEDSRPDYLSGFSPGPTRSERKTRLALSPDRKSPSVSSTSTERPSANYPPARTEDKYPKMPQSSVRKVKPLPTEIPKLSTAYDLQKRPSEGIAKSTAPAPEPVKAAAKPPPKTWATTTVSAPQPKKDYQAAFDDFKADDKEELPEEIQAAMRELAMFDPRAGGKTASSSKKQKGLRGKSLPGPHAKTIGATKPTAPVAMPGKDTATYHHSPRGHPSTYEKSFPQASKTYTREKLLWLRHSPLIHTPTFPTAEDWIHYVLR